MTFAEPVAETELRDEMNIVQAVRTLTAVPVDGLSGYGSVTADCVLAVQERDRTLEPSQREEPAGGRPASFENSQRERLQPVRSRSAQGEIRIDINLGRETG